MSFQCMPCALTISLAVGRPDHILIPDPTQTLKTQHQQAHTTVRRNRHHLILQDEEDGLARLRILELGEFSIAFTLHVTF